MTPDELPPDLLERGYTLRQRSDGSYIAVSVSWGVATGANVKSTITAARSLIRFLEWMERKGKK